MRELASWLGIDYQESLSVSSVGGKICVGNSGTSARVTGFAGPDRSKDDRRTVTWLEHLRVETLLRGPMDELGYSPEIPETPWSTFAGFLALFVPLRSEFRPAFRSVYRDTQTDHASFPLDLALMFLLRHRHPVLARGLRRLGCGSRETLVGRAFAASLVWGLALRRIFLDPLYFYAKRVALFVTRFSRLSRTARSGTGMRLSDETPGRQTESREL
ncbi:MAG: hypothetical protein IPL90_15430 [Holophagales bacterium]|nr:hypothetical protein [Holophagales bacterium]